MRVKMEESQSLEIQMGPMIDCVFLLLLYFMTSAQIKPEEKYLGINIPSSAVASKESLPAELTVAIKETGEVLCNQVVVGTRDDRSLDGLRSKLLQVIQLFGEKQPVVLHPEPKVRHQQIVDVLNACAASGVKNLSFFANP